MSWLKVATRRIEEVFDERTYVVDEDFETYVLTPAGWQSFGILGSPDCSSRMDFWERWNKIVRRVAEPVRAVRQSREGQGPVCNVAA
jgi:hypothetical protein